MSDELSLLREKEERTSNDYIKKLETQINKLREDLESKDKELTDMELYTQSVKEENRILQKNIDYMNERVEKINTLKKTSSVL